MQKIALEVEAGSLAVSGSPSTLSVAPIVPSLRAPRPCETFPQQLLTDLFTVRSVDVDERPVRLGLVHRAAEHDTQSLLGQ